jgi:hypothetical protein
MHSPGTHDFTGRLKTNTIKVIRSERRALGTVVIAAELRLVGISLFVTRTRRGIEA